MPSTLESQTPIISPAPTDCLDNLIVEHLSSAGSDISLPNGVLKIRAANVNEVEFVVQQLWSEESVLGMLAVHYHNGVGSTVCDQK
jgi:hypothetical protein